MRAPRRSPLQQQVGQATLGSAVSPSEKQKRRSALLRLQAAVHCAAFSLFPSPRGSIWFDQPPLCLELGRRGRVYLRLHPQTSSEVCGLLAKAHTWLLSLHCPHRQSPVAGEIESVFTNKTHCPEISISICRTEPGGATFLKRKMR